MAEQYEFMTLDVENGKVVRVDKPQTDSRYKWGGGKPRIFEPNPKSLVNQSIASALNQLSSHNWEIIRMPSGESQSGGLNPFPGLSSRTPLPNTDKYQVLLRRAISK